MFKKIQLWNFMQVILITLTVGGAIYLGLHIRMQNAKAELDEYKQAEFCQGSPECRQIVEGITTYSKTAKKVFSVPSSRTSSRGITSFNYIVHFNAGEQDEVKILPAVSIDTKNIDPSQAFIRLPIWGEESRFAEDSFPVGSSIKVESWRGKTTILFSTRINYSGIFNNSSLAMNDFYAEAIATFTVSSNAANNNDTVSVPIKPNDIASQDQTYLSATKNYPEVAVPTTNNPLIYYESTKNDLSQATIAVGSFIVFLIFLKFMFSIK